MSKRKSTLPEKAAKHARICCPFCADTFKYAGDMVRHQGVKHTDKLPHPCKQCYRAFASDGELATHVHEAHTLPFMCTVCRERFETQEIRKEHIASAHDGKTAQCGQCEKLFYSKASVDRHVQRVHVNPKVLKRPKASQCAHCTEAFGDKYNRIRHYATVHKDIYAHHCSHCYKAFQTSTELETHMTKTHLFPIACDLCDARFSQKVELETHRKIHGRKPFECPNCKKRFEVGGSLARHLKKKHTAAPTDDSAVQQNTKRRAVDPNATKCPCGKRARFGTRNPNVLLYCSACAKKSTRSGIVSLGTKWCEFGEDNPEGEPCPAKATHGYPNTRNRRYCATHAHEHGMVRILSLPEIKSKRELCSFCTVERTTYERNNLKYCIDCAKGLSENPFELCVYNGCRRKAVYGDPRTHAKQFCSISHATDANVENLSMRERRHCDFIDLEGNQCTSVNVCYRETTNGILRWCSRDHAPENALYCGKLCKVCLVKRARYGPQGEAPQVCAQHNSEKWPRKGDIMCIGNDCDRLARWGKQDGRCEFCYQCVPKDETYVCLLGNRCRGDNCNKHASLGLKIGRPMYCRPCLDELVPEVERAAYFTVTGSRCSKENCDKLAQHGQPGRRDRYCFEHRLEGDFTLSAQCSKCNNRQAKRDGYCTRCHPDYVSTSIGTSKIGCQWIDELETIIGRPIQHSHYDPVTQTVTPNEYRPPCMLTRPCDGYDSESNTIYEFHGDIYHGHPRLWDSVDDCNHFGQSYAKLYDKTVEKSKTLFRNGYKVVYIWESTYYKYLKNPDDLLAHCYAYQGEDFLVVQ